MLKISHRGNANQYYNVILFTLMRIASIQKAHDSNKKINCWIGLEYLSTAGRDGGAALFGSPSKMKHGGII